MLTTTLALELCLNLSDATVQIDCVNEEWMKLGWDSHVTALPTRRCESRHRELVSLAVFLEES